MTGINRKTKILRFTQEDILCPIVILRNDSDEESGVSIKTLKSWEKIP